MTIPFDIGDNIYRITVKNRMIESEIMRVVMITVKKTRRTLIRLAGEYGHQVTIDSEIIGNEVPECGYWYISGRAAFESFKNTLRRTGKIKGM